MSISTATAKASDMLSDLKSRLGFKHDDRYDDDYDEYDNFDDGFNSIDDKEYAGYGSDYNEDLLDTGYVPASVGSSSSVGRFSRSTASPDLVTISDVKAHSRASDDSLRNPSTFRSRPSSRVSGGRNFDVSETAQASTAYNTSWGSRSSQMRSEGLNSLFEPTSSDTYDPYAAYSGTGSTSFTSRRKLSVITPLAYADVEQVSRALKAGDVVVLVMRSMSDDLSKRVLDFSFGVASALDASVECPAEKVFAIARGTALTEAEKSELSTQGVL